MKDFAIKHPIITMLMFSDLCLTIRNIALFVTKSNGKVETNNIEDFKDIAETGIEAAKDAIKKRKKVEIGFHK